MLDRARILRLTICLPALVCLPLLLWGCGAPEAPARRFLVVGIDGADWDVLRELFSQGRLPNLQALSERGVSATLKTDYGISPTIWTTIATGMTAEHHGIANFLVPTESGNQPANSSHRRVPAIWNMLSAAERRVGVVYWWLTWPAERVNGVVVSDLVDRVAENGTWPPERAARVAELVEEAKAALGDSDVFAVRDRVSERIATELLGEGLDLVMAYFRQVDTTGHNYWKYFRPERYGPIPAAELEAHADRVPDAYAAVDAALGRLLETAGPETNVLVMSDHGFYGLPEEEILRTIDFDALLAKLGFLERTADGVDLAKSRLYTYTGWPHRENKTLRYALAGREPGGTVRPEERAAIRRELEAALEEIRNVDGEPVFWVRDPRARRGEQGADLVVRVRLSVLGEGGLMRDGKEIRGILGPVSRISGSHGARTHGVFLAAGPDIDPAADLTGIRIFDVTPTLLYGLGLPVAEDFDGLARTELYTAAFRARNPLRTIPTWGKPTDGEARESEADPALIDELRALGYLD